MRNKSKRTLKLNIHRSKEQIGQWVRDSFKPVTLETQLADIKANVVKSMCVDPKYVRTDVHSSGEVHISIQNNTPLYNVSINLVV